MHISQIQPTTLHNITHHPNHITTLCARVHQLPVNQHCKPPTPNTNQPHTTIIYNCCCTHMPTISQHMLYFQTSHTHDCHDIPLNTNHIISTNTLCALPHTLINLTHIKQFITTNNYNMTPTTSIEGSLIHYTDAHTHHIHHTTTTTTHTPHMWPQPPHTTFMNVHQYSHTHHTCNTSYYTLCTCKHTHTCCNHQHFTTQTVWSH